ncbi:hypothetical protein SAMN06265795_12437 [Noviherbaspirillum humi]|uniref:Uncharacterized protein n=1 Tax=Noviherbaspirillum humi TaxID=1688639 RepID=A0A239LL41_9BURK|nr:hypothetical protein [Noviherbaspirillum humi]SNT31286.1 hypothetical protein SAMN06265795_12437 [Noviherbaspirillum humi]
MLRCFAYFLWAVVRLPHDLFHSLYRDYCQESGQEGRLLLYRLQALVAVTVGLLNLVFIGHLPDWLQDERPGSELAFVLFIDYFAWCKIGALRRILNQPRAPHPAPADASRPRPPSSSR